MKMCRRDNHSETENGYQELSPLVRHRNNGYLNQLSLIFHCHSQIYNCHSCNGHKTNYKSFRQWLNGNCNLNFCDSVTCTFWWIKDYEYYKYLSTAIIFDKSYWGFVCIFLHLLYSIKLHYIFQLREHTIKTSSINDLNYDWNRQHLRNIEIISSFKYTLCWIRKMVHIRIMSIFLKDNILILCLL